MRTFELLHRRTPVRGGVDGITQEAEVTGQYHDSRHVSSATRICTMFPSILSVTAILSDYFILRPPQCPSSQL